MSTAQWIFRPVTHISAACFGCREERLADVGFIAQLAIRLGQLCDPTMQSIMLRGSGTSIVAFAIHKESYVVLTLNTATNSAIVEAATRRPCRTEDFTPLLHSFLLPTEMKACQKIEGEAAPSHARATQ